MFSEGTRKANTILFLLLLLVAHQSVCTAANVLVGFVMSLSLLVRAAENSEER